MPVAPHSRSIIRERRSASVGGALAILAIVFLAIAGRAQASESIYWVNYESNSIAFSAMDGSGGGILNLGGESIEGPEGMAYDPANGRMYVANSWNHTITWAAVDGTGGGVLKTPGVTIEDPRGITIDPRTQIIYWTDVPEVNEEQEGEGPEATIDWAYLDGSGAGVLDTAGAPVEFPTYMAIDTADNRVYWANGLFFFSGFSWASLDGRGGGEVDMEGAPSPYNVRGLNVDPASGRLYWMDLFSDFEQESVERIAWVNLAGGGGGEIDASGVPFYAPYGLAFDPEAGSFYWANWGAENERTDALGTISLSGVGHGITPVAAPVSRPNWPVVLKSPTGSKAPQVTRNGTALSCSQGTWSQDYPGSFVYGAPTSFSYRWLKDGTLIEGANSNAYTATTPGTYSCAVTATNVSGSATQSSSSTGQSSGSATVTGPSLSMALAPPQVKVKAGKTAKVTVNLTNGGQLPSVAVRVCPEMSMKAKKGLKVPYCASVNPIAAGASVPATLSVKAKNSAKGTYKFTIRVKGEEASTVVASVKVTAKKKKH